MNATARGGPYDIQFSGIRLTVYPGVYAPGFFTDTMWFSSVLPGLVRGKSLLEIGTGTGVIAIVCALGGANVIATDNNPEAVRNARINAERCMLHIPVREGHLYQPISSRERFDFIFWAHPFNNWPCPVHNHLLQSGLDYHYNSLKGYIKGASNHLACGGRLLLGTGDSADLTSIEQIVREFRYLPVVLLTKTMALESGGKPITYILLELVPKSVILRSTG